MAALLHSPLALLIAQLLVIIAAARLLGLVARKLQQPLAPSSDTASRRCSSGLPAR